VTPSNWFIYTDDLGAEWAMQVPRDIGQHPAMGFLPLGGRKLPELRIRYTYVGPVRPRHVRIVPPGPVGPVSRTKTHPVGTQAAFLALGPTLNQHQVTLILPDRGHPAEWIVVGLSGEEMTFSRYQKARAAFPQVAPPPRLSASIRRLLWRVARQAALSRLRAGGRVECRGRGSIPLARAKTARNEGSMNAG